MGETVLVERRRRGVFGWLCLGLLLLWQALILWWAGSYMLDVGGMIHRTPSEAGRAGAVIGTSIGLATIALVWFFGTLLFGTLAALTRGRKEWVRAERASPPVRRRIEPR